MVSCGIILFIFGIVSVQAQIAPGWGDGADGDLDVSGTSYTDDVRAAVTGVNEAGQNTVKVADASGFSTGDEVLIISMQDPETNLELNVAGQHETKRITNISGNILTLNGALLHLYDAGGDRKHEVLRVPQFRDVTVHDGGTITCHNWDGTTGGIVFFRATGTVTVESGGKIDVSGKGYRGGESGVKTGQSGEGIGGGEGGTSDSIMEAGELVVEVAAMALLALMEHAGATVVTVE